MLKLDLRLGGFRIPAFALNDSVCDDQKQDPIFWVGFSQGLFNKIYYNYPQKTEEDIKVHSRVCHSLKGGEAEWRI